MTDLLTRLFIKDRENVKDAAVRRAYGTMVSITGVVLNLLLSAFKLLAGTLSGSIAIRADALNNLSDACSSMVSFFSFKLSAKPADRDHPYGHARMEYIASMIVSFLILFVGVELIKGSVQKLIAPAQAALDALTVVILSVSVCVKLWMALFNHKIGRRIGSDVMRATAVDSLSDAGATAAVLAASLISRLLPAKIAPYIDPVMGLLVALLIFWAGLRILNDTKNSLLGSAPDEQTLQTIREVVQEYPEALGIHDLVVHNYGPNHTIASLHVEVDGHKDIFASHDAIDLIERRLRGKGIECTIHLDPIVVNDDYTNEWRTRAAALAATLHPGIRIHDFRIVPGTTHTNLIFDMEVPFEVKQSDDAIKSQMAELVGAEAPNFFTVITVDRV